MLARKICQRSRPTTFSSLRAMATSDSPVADREFPFARPRTHEPPAEYAMLRQQCPVAQAKLFDGSPIWLLTKLKDCQQVLVDNRFSKVRTHPGFPELVPGAKAAVEGREPTFVDQDPPQHTKFRGFIEPYFTAQYGEKMRPGIRQKVDELIDDMKKGSKPANLQEAFSLPLAFKVIYELLGIPFSDYDFLSNNIAMRTSGSSTARDAAAAQQELTDYMERLVDSRVKDPREDVISWVIRDNLKKGEISRDQLAAHAFLLVVAGNATVASMINLGVMTLLDNPDQLEALKSDPSLLNSAVHEICRYHTASSYALRRVALEDVQVRDKTVKRGEGVIALNQSANRDEEHFPDPDRFDIRRSPNPEIAFGYGTHECIAMPLSFVELEEAFRGLFDGRLNNLRLAVPASQLQFSEPRQDVGLVEMPVTWD
ncbi:hypothetical protein ABPG77_005418 [Micractinium sp. CCAP 211/92]